MIDAREFVDCASGLGYRWYAGVPCSFLTSLINCILGDEQLTYVASPNEGDAVAAAAGACLGGLRSVAFMQNSGLGNAVSPLASLTYVFRIPVLLIVTLRGEPGVADEPQHELMGRITTSLLDELAIPWAWFPASSGDIEPVLQQAHACMQQTQRPYALVVRKASIGGACAATRQATAGFPVGTATAARAEEITVTRRAALTRILDYSPPGKTVVIAATGYTGRELYALADRPNHLYMAGSMGCASALGLGLSMVRPDLQILVIDGDGAVLMRMGNLAAAGRYGGDNLVHIVLDNEVHESTGAQPTVSGSISIAGIAHACAYPHVEQGSELAVLDRLFAAVAGGVRGPHLAHVRIRAGTGTDLPRPHIAPAEVRRRLMNHIGPRP